MTFDDFCKQFKATKAERQKLWLHLAFIRLVKMLEVV